MNSSFLFAGSLFFLRKISYFGVPSDFPLWHTHACAHNNTNMLRSTCTILFSEGLLTFIQELFYILLAQQAKTNFGRTESAFFFCDEQKPIAFLCGIHAKHPFI